MFPILSNGVMITVKIRYVSGQDDYGNDILSFTTQQVGPCAVQQGSSRETTNFDDQTVTDITVFAPHGSVVGYIDSIIVDGVEYEVAADPAIWVSPFSGHSAPLRIEGRIVKGAS